MAVREGKGSCVLDQSWTATRVPGLKICRIISRVTDRSDSSTVFPVGSGVIQTGDWDWDLSRFRLFGGGVALAVGPARRTRGGGGGWSGEGRYGGGGQRQRKRQGGQYRIGVGCRYRSGSPAEVIGRLCRKLEKLVLLAQPWLHGRRSLLGSGMAGGGGGSNKRERRETARGRDWQEMGWATSGDGESAVTRLGDGSAIVAPTTAVKSLLLQTLIPFVCVMMKARRWGGSVSKQKLQHNIPYGYLMGRYEECHPSASSEQPGRGGSGSQLSPEAEAPPSLTLTGLSRTTRHCVSTATQERCNGMPVMRQLLPNAATIVVNPPIAADHGRHVPGNRRIGRLWYIGTRWMESPWTVVGVVVLPSSWPAVSARCLDHRGPSKAAGTVNPSSAFHSLASRNRRELSGENQFHARHPNSNCRCRCRCPVDIQKLPLPFPKPNAAQ